MSPDELEALRQKLLHGYRKIARESRQIVRDANYWMKLNPGASPPTDIEACHVTASKAEAIIARLERHENIPDQLYLELCQAAQAGLE